jgi:hypothetical protein
MKNSASIPHNIAIEGRRLARGHLGRQLPADGELTPGKCTFLCTVPGDADGGMKGELPVK